MHSCYPGLGATCLAEEEGQRLRLEVRDLCLNVSVKTVVFTPVLIYAYFTHPISVDSTKTKKRTFLLYTM
jgi:hypothetical protein